MRHITGGAYAQESLKISWTEALCRKDPVVARQSLGQIRTVSPKGDIGIKAISDDSHLSDRTESICQNERALEHQEKVRLIAVGIAQQGGIEFCHGGAAERLPGNPHREGSPQWNILCLRDGCDLNARPNQCIE